MNKCHACRKELSLSREIGRRDECPFCRADLHCCLNCGFYAPSAPRQCREPVAEAVKEKERANYCDYFIFAVCPSAGAPVSEIEKSRKALDELFKK